MIFYDIGQHWLWWALEYPIVKKNYALPHVIQSAAEYSP